MERWIQSCRRELLDRTLIWNQRHLRHALCTSTNDTSTRIVGTGGIANTRPLHPLPDPIADPDIITQLHVRRRDRLGGLLHEYEPVA
jgi:putative transposase